MTISHWLLEGNLTRLWVRHKSPRVTRMWRWEVAWMQWAKMVTVTFTRFWEWARLVIVMVTFTRFWKWGRRRLMMKRWGEGRLGSFMRTSPLHRKPDRITPRWEHWHKSQSDKHWWWCWHTTHIPSPLPLPRDLIIVIVQSDVSREKNYSLEQQITHRPQFFPTTRASFYGNFTDESHFLAAPVAIFSLASRPLLALQTKVVNLPKPHYQWDSHQVVLGVYQVSTK